MVIAIPGKMWYNEKNGKESVKIMKYNVVSPFEFTYPDVWNYATGSTRADVFAPRGGFCWETVRIIPFP